MHIRILAMAAWATLVCAIAAAGDGKHEGEFASSRPDHVTSIQVLEGENAALIAYSGSYGPGCGSETGWCRTCSMTPRTGEREPAGSYLFTDEFGKLRLRLVEGAWRLELADGFMGWCGAGWGWDAFNAGTSVLETCVVHSATARWYTFPESTAVPAGSVAQGSSVRVVTSPLEADEAYVMGRAGSVMGILKRADLGCEAHR